MRYSSIHVNIKAVRRIMKGENLALPCAKHKNRTRSKDLTKPENSRMIQRSEKDTKRKKIVPNSAGAYQLIREIFNC